MPAKRGFFGRSLFYYKNMRKGVQMKKSIFLMAAALLTQNSLRASDKGGNSVERADLRKVTEDGATHRNIASDNLGWKLLLNTLNEMPVLKPQLELDESKLKFVSEDLAKYFNEAERREIAKACAVRSSSEDHQEQKTDAK